MKAISQAQFKLTFRIIVWYYFFLRNHYRLFLLRLFIMIKDYVFPFIWIFWANFTSNQSCAMAVYMGMLRTKQKQLQSTEFTWAWLPFSISWSRLPFYLLQILQDCPEEPEAINDEEQFDEIEAVGKSLLDRLTVPVVYPDGYDTCSYNFVFLLVNS